MNSYSEKEIIQSVPLDYHYPDQASITLFARDICLKDNSDAEILVFFNGGPGFSCLRDWRNTPWVIEALKTYRIILLDQRGTGRSELLDLHHLPQLAAHESLSDYLSHFRADNIVRDTEFLRQHYFSGQKITLLGQSFGGFIVTHYVSQAPHALRGALITAGIPPLTCHSVEAVYRPLLQKIAERNQRFYQHYPDVKGKVAAIVALLKQPAQISSGEALTLARFLDLGWYLGQENGFDMLYQLIDEAFTDASQRSLSWRFIQNVLQMTSFWELNPIYSLLHEAIYCQGYSSAWAAARVKDSLAAFALDNTVPYFSGEIPSPHLWQDYSGLYAWRDVATALAQKTDWPQLYDLDALAKNTVPIEALLMTDDFYVNHDLAIDASACIGNIHLWHHKTWQHDALKKHGKHVIRTLVKRLEKRIALNQVR